MITEFNNLVNPKTNKSIKTVIPKPKDKLLIKLSKRPMILKDKLNLKPPNQKAKAIISKKTKGNKADSKSFLEENMVLETIKIKYNRRALAK